MNEEEGADYINANYIPVSEKKKLKIIKSGLQKQTNKQNQASKFYPSQRKTITATEMSRTVQ